jgi:hypothetical protein
LTKIFWGVIMKTNEEYEQKYKESYPEVETYLARLRYALQSGRARINFQKERLVDEKRDRKYTNRYAMASLFPDEEPVEALKRELACLNEQEYIETVKDTRHLTRSDMRVFGKKYSNEDVYIKLRVELIPQIGAVGDNFIFVMSFHFAERAFVESDFPYRKRG